MCPWKEAIRRALDLSPYGNTEKELLEIIQRQGWRDLTYNQTPERTINRTIHENPDLFLVFNTNPQTYGLREVENLVQKSLAINKTEKLTLTQARRVQQKFRSNVESIEKRCRLTGITSSNHLCASHIRPWSQCETGDQRIDGHNGFLLSPNADHLFDRGFITFAPEGFLMLSSRMERSDADRFGVKDGQKLQGPAFTSRQTDYLAYHHHHVFRD